MRLLLAGGVPGIVPSARADAVQYRAGRPDRKGNTEMGNEFEAVVSAAKKVFGSRVIGRGKSNMGRPVVLGRGGVPFELIDQGCTALVQTPNGYPVAVDYCRLSRKQIGSRLLDILEEEEYWRRRGKSFRHPRCRYVPPNYRTGLEFPGRLVRGDVSVKY